MAAADLAGMNLSLLAFALFALATLGACSASRPGPDQLELATIAPWYEVPKSSPHRLLATFHRFCITGPRDMTGADVALRAAGYVPKHRASARRAALYVVDDSRPAVLLSDQLCGVRTVSRTGQTNAVNRYVAQTFPEARPLAPSRFGGDVEQAWQITGGMLATMRNDWIGNRAAYTVSVFRPDT